MEGAYKVIEVIGSSESSWEAAAQNAVSAASKTFQDLRIAEVKEMDMKIEGGTIVGYRTKLKLSFKIKE
ncbi:MAG: dodecin domain-containing protein [Spirochaetes bacterium]|nr:dodecin domain-containing protein [Spirochaetota bacterium]